MYYSQYESPVGQLLLVGDGNNIHRIDFPTTCRPVTSAVSWELDASVFKTVFSVSVAPEGSDFQQKVWKALRGIEYGQTCTYADIAKSIGKPTASRAVGSANGRNPVSILIPCHRVIGANGSLTGYAAGLNTKHWLLMHEAGEQCLFPFDEW